VTDIATATAAPVEVEIDGKKYWMSPLTERDYGELDRWVRARAVQMARDSLGDNPTVGEVRLTMDEAFRSALGMSCIEEPRLLAGLEGFARIVWQQMRAKHPDVDYDQIVIAFRKDSANVQRAHDAIRLLRLGHSSEQKDDSKNPTIAAAPAT